MSDEILSPAVIELPPGITKATTKRHIRGSSLLMVGQFFSKGITFAIQVLIVRYLSKSDYGAYAYALSIATIGVTITTLGLDRAITRFVPIYHEKGEYNKMFGTILMVLSSIISLGVALILLFIGLQGVIAGQLISDPQAASLLLILIFIAPVDALDSVLTGMFAVFSRPGAIFFRKYVLGPGFKLVVVLLLILSQSGVRFLAVGYVAVDILVVVIFTVVLFRALRQLGVLEYFNRNAIQVPAREVLAFTLPLLASDLVYVVMHSADVLLLQYFYGTVDVAALRAVQPTAKMNQLVLMSYGLLFTPAAARMFARNDREGINNLYWQNAIWVAVASFPIFALTFSLAKPITLLLYGNRYAESAIILALLSFGYYFNAATGQNGLTLKVYGKIRYVVAIDLFIAVLNVVVALLLIPRYGALGAAIGTTFTMILFNILKQAGLALGTGVNLFEWHYARVYVIIVLGATVLGLVQWLTNAPPLLSILFAGLVSTIVFLLNRRALNISQNFPELSRIPLLKRILG